MTGTRFRDLPDRLAGQARRLAHLAHLPVDHPDLPVLAAQEEVQEHSRPLRFAGLNLLCACNVRWVRVGQGEEH